MDKRHLSLSHPCFLDHGVEEHPENRTRLEAILKEFSTSPYIPLLDLSCSRVATIDELSLVHDRQYIEWICSLKGKFENIDHETLITEGSVQAALIAVGLGIELVERVLKKEIQNGFALLRPPGHHARPQIGMGFCIFNNIAIAAKKALELGVKRILIIDWDVHHGNGTQEAFYNDDRVFLMDFHQADLFPINSGRIFETGAGKGAGYTLNIPLPPNCHDGDYLYIFDHLVAPIARTFSPELILVSAGFDAHVSDPLGFMKLTTPGYGKLTSKIRALSDELAQGKLLFFLEGGYNPFWLAKNVLECVRVLSSTEVGQQSQEDVTHTKIVEHLIEEIYAARRIP